MAGRRWGRPVRRLHLGNVPWYLLNQGICTQDLCLEFDMTASLELMYTGFGTRQDAYDMVDGVTSMRLHLSDEGMGLPPISSIPVSAGLPLLLAGLGALGLVRRRKSGNARA